MRPGNDSFERIREELLRAKTVLLAGHINPDGDAIGACLAFAGALEKSGRQAGVLLEAYAEKYRVIPNSRLLIRPEEAGQADLFLSLDCGDPERLGAAREIFLRTPMQINIDHHESNTGFGTLRYVDAAASSTSELVYELIHGVLPIGKDEAAGLYAGLVYDTGGFRHSSTSPRTMQAAGELMQIGIPFTEIYNELFDARSFSEAKILGKALENAELLFGGRVICSTITNGEIAACGGTNKELDSVINYLKGVRGVEVACFFYEKTETEVKGSFRGNDGYDVCTLARKFGGGGHIKAAGCTIAAPIAKAREMALAEVGKMV